MDPVTNTSNDNYHVDLEVFSGPMDLLLYLIKKEEVDIYNIPIARITSRYLKYVQMIEKLNLELAGEFVLMAATLIRLKTRMLLPREDEAGDEIDPREELIMALLEYKKFKEAGDILRERAMLEERNYVPPSPVGKIKGRVDLEPVTSLYDLLMAFRDVVSVRREDVTHDIDPEEITVEDRVRLILALLADKEYGSFIDLFSDFPRKIVAVVTFIALLELARNRRIKIVQAFPFSELRVYRGELYAEGASFLERPTEETVMTEAEV